VNYLIPVGYLHRLARVLCQKHDDEGNPMDTSHYQPTLDNCVVFLTAEPKNWLSVPLLRCFMLSAMPMRMSKSYLIPLGITTRIPTCPSLAPIRSRLLMARRLCLTPHMEGILSVNGRMALLLGRSCLIGGAHS
jgi:hypothetical protein